METIAVPRLSDDEPDVDIELTHIGRDPWGRNQWSYRILRDGRSVIDGADLTTARVRPPAETARTLMGFLVNAGESLELFGTESSYAGAYTTPAREFLVATYRRFEAALRRAGW